MDNAIIRVENLWWKYNTGREWVLKGVDFSVAKGEIVGIVGPSGVGKTTLCLCLTGLIPREVRGIIKGRVLINGMDTSTTPLPEIIKKVGIVFQDPETQFVTMKVLDEVAFPLENFGFPRDEILKRAEEALRVTRMIEYSDKYPFELSGGQKQRIAIASMLARRPEILILDEPTSDLDPLGKQEIFSVLSELRRRYNVTLIIVEHDTEKLARFADRILLLYDGRIIEQGPPREFFKNVPFLIEKGVYPPQVTEVFHRLDSLNQEFLPTTLEEAFKILDNLSVRDSSLPSFPRKRKQSGDPIIVMEEVEYVYPNGTKALKGVNLKIREGEFVAIIGQNGSGKTTLIKHIVGLLKPTNGIVKVFGIDTRHINISRLAWKIGYVYQCPDHQLFCTSVYEECAYALRNAGMSEEEIRERVSRVLEIVGLSGLEDVPPYFLSKGQRQRLAVAAVLAMEPEVIVVDEPTTGQDFVQSKGIMNLLKKLNESGRTIIVVTHNMRLVAEYAERVIVLKEGRVIADGDVREVMGDFELLRSTFLNPPQVTVLARKLVPVTVLTVEEMCRILMGDICVGEK